MPSAGSRRSPRPPRPPGSARGLLHEEICLVTPQCQVPLTCPFPGGRRLGPASSGGQRPRSTSGHGSRPGTSASPLQQAPSPRQAYPRPAGEPEAPASARGGHRGWVSPGGGGGGPADARTPSPAAPPASAGLEAWLKRGAEVLRLADAMRGPTALLAAMALDALGRGAPPEAAQAPLLHAVITHLEPSIYCPVVTAGAPDRQQPTPTDSARAVMPPQYAGRTPWFVLARRQQERMQELQDFVQHLQKVASKSERVGVISASRWNAGDNVVTVRKDFANIRAVNAVLVWALGFWKFYQADSRRNNRKKAAMLEMTVVGDLVRPFRHWQIFVMEQRIEAQQMTQQAFTMERQMLEVTANQINEQKEDMHTELGRCNETLSLLQTELKTEARDRAELADRLEEAKPERVNAVLGSVLKFVFAAVLEEVQLRPLIVRRDLESKELAVLLVNEEESIQKLATGGDGLLTRWLNYHLTQFKVLSSEILESVSRARNDETSRLEPREGDMSLRDADSYCHRCRIVRGIQRVAHIGEELTDGAALSVLYAALASAVTSQGSAPNPALLWPLEERDIETRLEKLCDAFKRILPTHASQSLLQPSDIATGNSQVLMVVLSVLFLHRSRLPDAMPAVAFKSTTEQEDEDAMPAAPVTRRLAALDFDRVAGARARQEASQEADPTAQVTGALERVALASAYDALQDVARLLRDGETPGDLEHIEADELLLRWVNMKIESKDQQAITSMSELKGGKILYDLLIKIAADVLKLMPGGNRNVNAEPAMTAADHQRMVEIVVQCGNRCTSFPILTSNVVIEGPDDLLAAAVAGLFLCRPCLPVAPKSKLRKHLDLVEKVAMAAPKVSDDDFVDSCASFMDGLPLFNEATAALRAAGELQSRVERRVHAYLADILAQRAQGVPHKVLDAKGPDAHLPLHEALRPQFLAPDRIRSVLMLEMLHADAMQSQEEAMGQPEQLADILRRNRSLFKEMFKHYSTAVFDGSDRASRRKRTTRATLSQKHQSVQGSLAKRRGKEDDALTDGTIAMDLRSFTRIHKDCRVRSLKLTPSDVEEIFNDVLSRFNSAPGGKKPLDGLRFETFIEATLVMGCRIKVGDIPPFDFAKQFSYLVEKHFWPFATRQHNDILYRLMYDPGLTGILRKYDEMLRLVFRKYAAAQGDPQVMEVAMQMTSRGSIVCDPASIVPSSVYEGKDSKMGIAGLLAMFSHVGLKDQKLTDEALRGVVRGLQRAELGARGADSDSEGSSDSEDDSEASVEVQPGAETFAFQEFIDILVAVVMYKDPNPFTPFEIRFERLLLLGLLHPMKEYWHNRPPLANLGTTLEGILYRDDFQSRSDFFSGPYKESKRDMVPATSVALTKKRDAVKRLQTVQELG